MTTLHSRSCVDVRCVLITTPVVSEACSIVDHMAAVTVCWLVISTCAYIHYFVYNIIIIVVCEDVCIKFCNACLMTRIKMCSLSLAVIVMVF